MRLPRKVLGVDLESVRLRVHFINVLSAFFDGFDILLHRLDRIVDLLLENKALAGFSKGFHAGSEVALCFWSSLNAKTTLIGPEKHQESALNGLPLDII